MFCLNSHRSTACRIVAVACLVLVSSCSVTVQDGSISFSVLGGIFELTFNSIGVIAVTANEKVSVPTAVRLFEQTPSTVPPTGQMTLPSSSIGVAQRLTAKTIVSGQIRPPNGTATIRFNVAAGQSAALCDSAVLLAEYNLVVTSGVAAILDEVYDIDTEALQVIVANDVTICIEITSDFNGEITIGDYFLAFGGGLAGTQPASALAGPAVTSGGLTQIPIDSLGGVAAATPINLTVGGVSYGIVGVLEAQTSAVTTTAGESSVVTVVPADLGLATVDTLYMATHSAFVPDVGDGVTLATLEVSYVGGGDVTSLDFVTGSTTAEWSYDRLEHTADFGGVQHAKADVLYSFDSTVDSTATYSGYSYSVTLAVDSSRTIASVSLSMADPTTYARLATGDAAGWAGQAITAITLGGTALVIPDERACCFSDGSCGDFSPADCVASGGNAEAEGSRCVSTDCPVGGGIGDGEPEACCLPPAFGYEFTGTYAASCEDIGMGFIVDQAACRSYSGVPKGAGTTCATTECDDSFSACCVPPSDMGVGCYEDTFDNCMSRDGESMAIGVHCDDNPCDYACCFNDGQCDDTDYSDCVDRNGTPNTDEKSCSQVDCKGACCGTDGACTAETVDVCEDGGGDHRGIDVDCASVTCSSVGGCCFNDSLSCFDMDASTCTSQGGIAQTTCGPNQCIFACCLTDGTCSALLTVDECAAQSGTAYSTGTDCHSVTCAAAAPTKWVLAETRVNPNNYDNDTVGTGRFDGSFETYTTSANSITLAERDVDHGFENYNIVLTSTFATPPSELTPADTVTLSVDLTHSGTVAAFNPGLQFQYWRDEFAMDPQYAYQYYPWNPASADFGSDTSTTFSFVVPTVSTGGEMILTAGWWNCSECSVSWVYQPG